MKIQSTDGSGAEPGIAQTIEHALVIGTFEHPAGRARADIEVAELEELARTLGIRVVGREMRHLRDPNPATWIGAGALEEIHANLAKLGNPAVLFNDQLSPRQQRELQEAWKVPVLDRTEVILGIFAKRAQSAEGRIQVEMAQMEHLLPRLAGGWKHLERQRGGLGFGARGGPGEMQIEIDRRLIRQKLSTLKKKLKEIEKRRSVARQSRQNVPLPTCALVGYTNAGKSTLLNRLTNSKVLADNFLFATLDPVSRRLEFASGRRLILTDTVGFIQNLPTELVEAFAATLEEVKEASMLALVVDASHSDNENHLKTVIATLESMDCHQPRVLVISKCDKVDDEDLPEIAARLADIAHRPAVQVSAKQTESLSSLKKLLDEAVGNLGIFTFHPERVHN